MRSGSEGMHTRRRTPSTGRNLQTLIIRITVSYKASCNGSISVNNFFSWISSIFVGFFKISLFLCHLYMYNFIPVAVYTYMLCTIQGVTGGTDQTSGECSLGQTIPI